MHNTICQLSIAVWCNFRGSVCSSAISGKTPPHRQSYGHGCNIFMRLPFPWVFEETYVFFFFFRDTGLSLSTRVLLLFLSRFSRPSVTAFSGFTSLWAPVWELCPVFLAQLQFNRIYLVASVGRETMRRSFAAASCSSDGSVKAVLRCAACPFRRWLRRQPSGSAIASSYPRAFAATGLCCDGPLLRRAFAATLCSSGGTRVLLRSGLPLAAPSGRARL
nr:uncharacterized protein LOC129382265 [Dermacentor andersoni]XP_054921927.1 uncharacterized protein LOC129382265 [Dermacentor andersoni]